MNLVKFQRLLDSHGCDIGSWPEDDRLAAERFLARDGAARRAREQARGLDRLITECLAAEAASMSPDRAAARVLARLSGPLPSQRGGAPLLRLRVDWTLLYAAIAPAAPRIAALACAAALGVAAGFASAEGQSMNDATQLAAYGDVADPDGNAIFETDSLPGSTR